MRRVHFIMPGIENINGKNFVIPLGYLRFNKINNWQSAFNFPRLHHARVRTEAAAKLGRRDQPGPHSWSFSDFPRRCRGGCLGSFCEDDQPPALCLSPGLATETSHSRFQTSSLSDSHESRQEKIRFQLRADWTDFFPTEDLASTDIESERRGANSSQKRRRIRFLPSTFQPPCVRFRSVRLPRTAESMVKTARELQTSHETRRGAWISESLSSESNSRRPDAQVYAKSKFWPPLPSILLRGSFRSVSAWNQ